ncbi:MAG: cytidine deaminase [Candidatus Cloacimonadota bacterium]|nr:MAG: cytidine deaminase [Candidatus Cloacimonadota bacterium]
MKNEELIKRASFYICSKEVKGGLIGDVACALLTESNEIYTGVCASVGSNTFCAEFNAIGSMISNKEYKIKKIVAVWKDERDDIFVIPPCGNCRQFIYEIDSDNLKTIVVLDKNKEVSLGELLPLNNWWKKQD